MGDPFFCVVCETWVTEPEPRREFELRAQSLKVEVIISERVFCCARHPAAMRWEALARELGELGTTVQAAWCEDEPGVNRGA